MIACLAVALVALPILDSSAYTLHLAIMVLIAAILGMSFLMVYSSGLITLGAAAFYGIGAYSSALLAMKTGLTFWATLPLAVLITAAIAGVVGFAFIRSGTFIFVVLTMLFGLVMYQVFGSIGLFGGWSGLINVPRPEPIPLPGERNLEFARPVSFYYLGLALAASIVLVFAALYTSRIGRAWKAVKLSPRLAQSAGINVARYQLLSFVVGMSACGAMGSFYVHYFQVCIPEMFSGFVSVDIQLYAVLGGLGYYLAGPAVGAFIMVVVPEMLGISEATKPIVFGALLVIIIVSLPRGILGSLEAGSPRVRAGWRRARQVMPVRAGAGQDGEPG